MGFNRENYARIKAEYDGKYLRAEEEARFRRSEIHTRIPEVAKIDAELATSGVRVYEAAITGDKAMIDRIAEDNKRLTERREGLLVAAGFPKDYTSVKYECAVCRDTGVVDHRMCRCLKEKLILAGLESSGMGDLIKSQTFENFDLSYYSAEARVRMEAILGIVKKYAENFDPEKSGSVIMMGNTGLGKTHISSAMGGVIINNGYDVYYSTAVDMMSDFENERFSNVKSENLMTEKYFTCELLIIDDLGTELINQFTTSCLYNVINSRLIKKKPTVISTNFSRDELRKKYMDRITSRIFGEYTVLPFLGTDIREKKLQKR